MGIPLRIGIAGLGTVGGGVVDLLKTHAGFIHERAGRQVEIIAVSARNRDKSRNIDLGGAAFVEDARALAAMENIDVVVELIGGADGIAKDLVSAALSNGKHVVTANKALLARHGLELAQIAETNGTTLAIEASVAGGIPVIKTIREGLAANKISKITGILNGTCNFILSEMRLTGRGFAEVLKDAQEKGYAEADPTFDVDGIDAAHKLCLLSSIAFSIAPDMSSIDVKGIRPIGAEDISFAKELGYRIKLLGTASKLPDGSIFQAVEPCLVHETTALSNVEGVFNAVSIEGDFVGRVMVEGRGAGAGPTASAVVSDIMDVARGNAVPAFGVKTSILGRGTWASADKIVGSHYIRLTVRDEPGVISDVSGVLKGYGISIESLIQRGRDPGQPVPVIITTHDCSRESMARAADDIAALGCVTSRPVVMRIEGVL